MLVDKLVDRLIPLKEFVALHHRLGTEGTLRRWIRENYRGFAECAIRVGEKYYIDLDAVEGWLEEQRVNQRSKKTEK
jgi:hypothetical protein